MIYLFVTIGFSGPLCSIPIAKIDGILCEINRYSIGIYNCYGPVITNYDNLIGDGICHPLNEQSYVLLYDEINHVPANFTFYDGIDCTGNVWTTVERSVNGGCVPLWSNGAPDQSVTVTCSDNAPSTICDNIYCGNGICNNGRCECNPGYTGASCTLPIQTLNCNVAVYEVGDSSCATTPAMYNMLNADSNCHNIDSDGYIINYDYTTNQFLTFTLYSDIYCGNTGNIWTIPVDPTINTCLPFDLNDNSYSSVMISCT